MISDCILAMDAGGCKGLKVQHPHCGSKLCPFYKNIQMEQKSQSKCRKRAALTGVDFTTCYKLTKGEEHGI